MSVVNDKYIDDNKFFPDFDDDKMIYWEDEGVYYKYPNRITEENKLEVECFDIKNNKFIDFSGKSANEIADYCFSNNMSFGNEIGKYVYEIARESLIEKIKEM